MGNNLVKRAGLMGTLEECLEVVEINMCRQCTISPKLKNEYCSMGRCYISNVYDLQNDGRTAN